ncbi:DUF748 domain-containing protein [Litoribacter ruber]|uniref:DUF748 domain-containing protein n=1 Tax=Litoribacter ruber TaxID=702568 RepID=UPI001BDB6B30|nr:DUF748 domain-containing protein [Litoribacter ruber]MBT0809745.1 DUF748 domain-containing protein [Litoribacter ruber]
MTKKKKLAYIFLSITLFILLLVLVIPIGINMYLNANAEKIVGNMITRTNDFGGHEVDFGHIKFNYNFRGTFLELGDVTIKPGESIPEDKIKFDLTAENAYLTGFSWTSFLLNNSITLDSAYLENLSVTSLTPPMEDLEMTDEEEDDEEFGDNYDKISIERIRFNRLSYYNIDSGNDSVRMSIKDLSLAANFFQLTKEDLKSDKALFSVDMLEGYMDEAAYHFNEYRNVVYARDLSFNSQDRHLLIAGVELDNKLERYEYINQYEHETDWMELEQGEIDIQGMEFHEFFEKGIIHAETIKAKDLVISIFRDKRKPEDPTNRPEMVHDIIRDIPIPTFIHKLELENGEISYDERPDNQAPRAGSVFFKGVNATISNITNMDEMLAKNNEMDLQAEGLLMGEGAIDLNVTFFLEDENGRFNMNGMIGQMPLPSINKMLGPGTRIAIDEGTLNSLQFNITANDYEGTGDVEMRYQNLKIKILDSDYEKNQNIFRRAGAFLANTFVVRNDNPDSGGTMVKGDVYTKRDQTKFIFNYWWELLLSGMMSTMSGETEAEMREAERED